MEPDEEEGVPLVVEMDATTTQWNGLLSKLHMIDQGTDALAGVTSNWWGDLVKYSAKYDAPNARAMFKLFEREYRATYGDPRNRAMPGPYRSAKSVIMGALKEFVPLLEGEVPLGKSEIQRKLRVKRNKDTNPYVCPNCGVALS